MNTVAYPARTLPNGVEWVYAVGVATVLALALWAGVAPAPVLLAGLGAVAFAVGRRRVLALAVGARLHSRPHYHGWYLAVAVAGPALALWLAMAAFEGQILRTLAIGDVAETLAAEEVVPSADAVSRVGAQFFRDEVARATRGEELRSSGMPSLALVAPDADRDRFAAAVRTVAERVAALEATLGVLRFLGPLALATAGFAWAGRRLSPAFRSRNHVERWVVYLLVAAATVSILTTIGIVFSVVFETLRFFGRVPASEFLFGLNWAPQTAIRADQVAAEGAFGAVPLFAGTLLISAIAVGVAGPVGLFAAVYLAEFADSRVRTWAKPGLEVLAGVPTVVYGFFAALTVAPFIRDVGNALGFDVASQSALAAGSVMGIMIIPFISSLTDDAIISVPRSLRNASLGLGATRGETVTQVLLPAALPGIVAGFLLAVSRAIGETMIVVMAAGLAANLTANPLEAVTTVTVQIVTLLTGDQAFDSAKTLSAFALGFVLFVVTLLLNVIALYVMQRYREKYD